MLSKRQREIYDFVLSYADRHGYPPTVREIGEAVGLASPSTVHAHLANLERAGYLKRDPTKPRALEVLAGDRAAAGGGRARLAGGKEPRVLPLIGEIAAGGPLLAEENIEDYLAVPEPLESRRVDDHRREIRQEVAERDEMRTDRAAGQGFEAN